MHDVEVVHGQELVSFADDFALIAGIDRRIDLHRINTTIEKLKLKLIELGLTFNDKTQMIILVKTTIKNVFKRKPRK